MQPVKATPWSHGSGFAGMAPLHLNAVNGKSSTYIRARHLSSVICTCSSPTALLAPARGRSLGLSPAYRSLINFVDDYNCHEIKCEPTDSSLICRRGPANRLSPVMSSSYAEAKHVPDNGQTDRAQAWRFLLVPAVVTAILSRVIDGKGSVFGCSGSFC